MCRVCPTSHTSQAQAKSGSSSVASKAKATRLSQRLNQLEADLKQADALIMGMELESLSDLTATSPASGMMSNASRKGRSRHA